MRSPFAQPKASISHATRFFLDEYRAVFPVNVTSPLERAYAQEHPGVLDGSLKGPPLHEWFLPAQGLILVLEPAEGLLKVLRLEVGPIIVNHIEVGIDRLHGQEATETAAPTPAHDQVQS